MRIFRMEVIPRTIEIGRHDGHEFRAILPIVGLAHLDTRDLGNGVRFVGGLQFAGQEVFLFHGLGGVLGVDAG